MSEHAPYRPLSVLQVARGRVEAAHCGWCRFKRRFSDCCNHPVVGHPIAYDECRVANPRGECPHWEPTWSTRCLRRLRLGRAPVLVDPLVWDEDTKKR